MKKRLGFFDFTGCEGCQLSVLNLEDQMLELLEQVVVVEFREIMDAPTGQTLDIAFIEGSICLSSERKRLKAIRGKSKILVALGACADMAGVNAMRRLTPGAQLWEEVYGIQPQQWLTTEEPRPISAIVPVDYVVPGCPIDGKEFLSVLTSLLLNKEPELPGYSLCVDCKLAELACTFERGEICLGPVTRAGCKAICIAAGDRCRGCRGLIDNPRSTPFRHILIEHGLQPEDILREFRTFNIVDRKDDEAGNQATDPY